MKISKTQLILIPVVFLSAGVVLGWLFASQEPTEATTSQAVSTEVWTCSMHPAIRQNEPGKCPICGMDLIPEGGEEEYGKETSVIMSPTAMKLANVETLPVGEDAPVKTIDLNGKVTADEREVFSQTTHIPGRIEQLKVNFTGDYVRRGETIAEIYSPELVTAQEELLEAQKMQDLQPGLLQAARTKLRNWKISSAQIEGILQSGRPRESFPITADRSGYVLEKMVNPGDHLKEGEALYKITDLSRVWILLDVYESDLRWVKKGDSVTISIPSVPGKTFRGTISFIDPVINTGTRVATARVELDNKNDELKPAMYVTGAVNTTIEGKHSQLVVPKTAILWTGKRSVVYVMDKSDRKVSFSMREVVLGPSLGDSYIVQSGLKKGEEIAVNGTFSIDAAAQLSGKPSMMTR